MKKYLLSILVLSLVIFISYSNIKAEISSLKFIKRYYIDSQTAKKGYTFKIKNIILGLLPNTIKKGELIFEVKDEKIDKIPKDVIQLSNIYTISLKYNNQELLLKKTIPLLFLVKSNIKLKSIFYFNEQTKEWIALASKIKDFKILTKIDFLNGKFVVLGSNNFLPRRIKIHPNIKNYQFSKIYKVIYIDEHTIKKGITLKYKNIELGIPKNSLPKPGWILFNSYKKDSFPLKQDIFSNIIEIEFDAFDGKSSKLNTPLYIKWILPKDNHNKFNIAILNDIENKWEVLKSIQKGNKVFSNFKTTFAQLALLKESDVYFGKASWYPTKLSKKPLSSACNLFKIGDKIKVTNLENRKQVIVQIRSTGPFVQGRIIDLTKYAFSKIANPKKGIINVKIEKLK